MGTAVNVGGALQRFHPSPFHSRALSHQWKQRRDADVYANMAIAEGLRSRAAYKLIEMNKRFGRFLRQGANVVDLGAAPGGFATVAASRIGLDATADRWLLPSRFPQDAPPQTIHRTLDGSQRRRKFGNVCFCLDSVMPSCTLRNNYSVEYLTRVLLSSLSQLVCVDLQEMEPIPGAQFVHADFMEPRTHEMIVYALRGREADVVMSDMSPSTTGDKGLNHDRITDLAFEAAKLARSLLRNGGVFVCKLFNGKNEKEFRADLMNDFLRVKAVKPDASRKTSPEIFYVATGFVPSHIRENTALSGDSVLPSPDEILDDLTRMSRRGNAPRP